MAAVGAKDTSLGHSCHNVSLSLRVSYRPTFAYLRSFRFPFIYTNAAQSRQVIKVFSLLRGHYVTQHVTREKPRLVDGTCAAIE